MSTFTLDDRQQQAVDHTFGPLLVLAGAGSGKTRVLTQRVARLIEEGFASASEIMAVTFTNKAATEMRKRIALEIGKNPANMMTICTFHSLGVKILREYGQYIGLKSDFKILSDNERTSTLKTLMRNSGKRIASQDVGHFSTAISLAKNAHLSPDEYHSLHPEQRGVAKVYEAYRKLLLKRQSVDFDDLLLLPLKLFNTHPEALEKFRSKYKFISIDEFQDTNTVQLRLARAISTPHNNLMVVGDDDQGIYSWRGAEIENILRFPSLFPNTKTIILNKNYRSTGHIVNGANALVSLNKQRKEKDIIAEAGAGEPIYTYKAEDEDGEVEWIINRIVDMNSEQHFTYERTAILFRANAHMRRFEEELRERRIPYHVHGAMSFFDRREVKDIFAYLNFFANTYDELSLERVIKVPDRGISKDTIQQLELYAGEHQCSLWEGFENVRNVTGLHSTQEIIVSETVRFINSFRERFEKATSLAKSLRELIDELKYIDAIKRIYRESKSLPSRLEVIEEIIHSLEIFEYKQKIKNEEISLSLFLQKMSLVDSRKESKGKGVTLMTIHKSKGLEFPVVFMPLLEDGVIPSKQALNEGKLEEERRLFYVGMTRAEKRLFLTFPKSKVSRGASIKVTKSRFLDDIPEENLDGKVGEKQDKEYEEMSDAFFAQLKDMF